MYQGVTKTITCKGCSAVFTATSTGRLPMYCNAACHRKNGPKCTVCGARAKSQSLCAKHQAQWAKHGGPVATRQCKQCGRAYEEPAEGRGKARATCSDECRSARTASHREKRAAALAATQCTITGCKKPLRSAGSKWCEMHYGRVRFNGDPGEAEERTYRYGDAHHTWAGDGVLYRSAHSRLTNSIGKASTFACVDCGRQAHHWSYDHSDPNEKWERVNGTNLPFSTDTSRYQPRCASCHRTFDQAYQ